MRLGETGERGGERKARPARFVSGAVVVPWEVCERRSLAGGQKLRGEFPRGRERKVFGLFSRSGVAGQHGRSAEEKDEIFGGWWLAWRGNASRAAPEASGGQRGLGNTVGVVRRWRIYDDDVRAVETNGAGDSRGGASEAKAVAETGSGVGERSEAGPRRQRAERHNLKWMRAIPASAYLNGPF